jgi:hypothetical protein
MQSAFNVAGSDLQFNTTDRDTVQPVGLDQMLIRERRFYPLGL